MNEEDWKKLDPNEPIEITIQDWDRWSPLAKALKNSGIKDHWVWNDPECLKMWLLLLIEAKE